MESKSRQERSEWILTRNLTIFGAVLSTIDSLSKIMPYEKLKVYLDTINGQDLTTTGKYILLAVPAYYVFSRTVLKKSRSESLKTSEEMFSELKDLIKEVSKNGDK